MKEPNQPALPPRYYLSWRNGQFYTEQPRDILLGFTMYLSEEEHAQALEAKDKRIKELEGLLWEREQEVRHAADKNYKLGREEAETEELTRLRELVGMAVDVMSAVEAEMRDAAGCIQLMKDGYGDGDKIPMGYEESEPVYPFGRLRALRHSFYGERDAGLRLKSLLAKLREKGEGEKNGKS